MKKYEVKNKIGICALIGGMKRMIRSERGEILAETLFSTLIISFGMVLLPGAIAAASKVNHKAEQQTLYSTSEAETGVGTVRFAGDANGETTVTMYRGLSERDGTTPVYYYYRAR